MRGRWFRLALGALLATSLTAPGGAEDRLERFRTLAREHPAAAGPAERARVVGALYELVDAEILDSLRSGEPFASVAFIQERLEALMEAWGGATLRALRVTGGRSPLTVGVFTLTGVDASGSLRVYSGSGASASLVATSTHDGLLDAQVWPVGRDGVPRLLALWSGPPSSPGLRALRGELWEGRGAEGAVRAWSTGERWPEGLRVSDWRAKPGELTLRYEVRYPGWKPGCPGQTEQEDSYRLGAAGGFGLARRHVVHGWHRELGAAVDRLFQALTARDERALAALVPEPGLRGRLPRALVPEPACEQQSEERPGAVVVAATEQRAGRPVPWALAWRRTGGGWRLTGAAPVLQ